MTWLKEQLAFAKKEVSSWPAWKRNYQLTSNSPPKKEVGSYKPDYSDLNDNNHNLRTSSAQVDICGTYLLAANMRYVDHLLSIIEELRKNTLVECSCCNVYRDGELYSSCPDCGSIETL